MIDGGSGHDTMWGVTAPTPSAGPTRPVRDRVDGWSGDDGVAGENEYVPSDFEVLQGGPFADTLYGKGAAPRPCSAATAPTNSRAGGGDDVLRGEAGNDALHINAGSACSTAAPTATSLSFAGAGQPVDVYQDGVLTTASPASDNVTGIERLTGTSYGDDL